ncbi:MAG: N-acetylmuramoyl-L-alanine amidase [Acutalibacteraceae bacterium]
MKKVYLSKNPCYKKGTDIGKVKGIVVHTTGAENKTLKRYVQKGTEKQPSWLGKNIYNNDWNKGNMEVCVHAFIGEGENKKVYGVQTLPYNIACWGCGSGTNGSYNYAPKGHIQFEICEGNKKDKEYFDKAYKKAVQYCVNLCRRFKLCSTDIVGHNEAHNKGYASNHGDPDIYFKIFGKSVKTLRKDVKAKLGR